MKYWLKLKKLPNQKHILQQTTNKTQNSEYIGK